MDRPDIAADIMRAPRAYDAMCLGQRVTHEASNTSRWDDERLNVMRLILALKYNASKDFREKLDISNDRHIVEATQHTFWGSGLPPKDTANHPMDSWPGQNKLGHLLMELRVSKKAPICDSYARSTEAIFVAEALIDKAIDPSRCPISSPDLIERAEQCIAPPIDQPACSNVATLQKKKGKHPKRKNISPVGLDDQSPEIQSAKRPANTLKEFFLRSKPNTKI